MIKAIFFDLDGTLIKMDEKAFVMAYTKELASFARKYGYDETFFSQVLFQATFAVLKNDGKKTNKELFWEKMNQGLLGEDSLSEEDFEEFYLHFFKNTFVTLDNYPRAKELIDFCKSHFQILALTSNPVFPRIATCMRMGISGLLESDFGYITEYTNSSYCKPNPLYFKEVLEKLNLKPEEVLLIGNNAEEDAYCASQVGISCVLLGEQIIWPEKIKENYIVLSYEEIIPYLQKLI